MSHEKLSDAAAALSRHLDEILHADGGCTCYNEGTCEWCRTHCLKCGATEGEHPIQEEGDEAPHCFQTLCTCVGDMLCHHCRQICMTCGCRRDVHPVTREEVDDWGLICEPHEFQDVGE